MEEACSLVAQAVGRVAKLKGVVGELIERAMLPAAEAPRPRRLLVVVGLEGVALERVRKAQEVNCEQVSLDPRWRTRKVESVVVGLQEERDSDETRRSAKAGAGADLWPTGPLQGAQVEREHLGGVAEPELAEVQS